MEEKTYKLMGGSGTLNLALGITLIAIGLAGGILLLISGTKLVAGRSKILF